MKPTLLIYTTSLFLASFLCLAQERPPVKVFTPSDYNAETQNWSISQSEDKYIYVANNDGLLEYNGAKWQLYPTPNQTILRSVSVIDSLIYTGCNRDFGYWSRNQYGHLEYSSLSKKLEVEFLEEEEIWNIIGLDDHILFQSLQRIYIYNKKVGSLSTLESESSISKMFKVNGAIYFQKSRRGLFKIEKGASKLVSDNSVVRDNVLVNIFYHREALLVETEDNGFYVIKNGALLPWNVPGNILISKVSVFRSVQLKDKSFILGTRSNGILHLGVDGNIDYKIDTHNGLSNNTIHFVFEDVDNNIWLALNNGVNCVNLKSPFRTYNDENGQTGTVYTSAIFNENLYLGTNQGLFFRPMNQTKGFTFIPGTQGAVWCLTVIDNKLFCGHDSGTFLVKGNQALKILYVPGAWNLKRINDELILQGNYDGLYVLEKSKDQWVLRNKIRGYNMSSKFFELHNTNQVLVNHEYKGVYNIVLNDSLTRAVKITKDPLISKELKSSLIKFNNDILFGCKEGVFKFDELENKFSKDTLLSKIILKEEYTSGMLVCNKETNTLWAFSKNNLVYVTPGHLSNLPTINKLPFSQFLPRGQTGYENITHLNDHVYLMGTTTGYLLVDLDKRISPNPIISISTILKTDLKNNEVLLNKTTHGLFKNKENNIVFNFSIPEYNKYADTEYQFQLLGIYPHWSNWSHEASATFNNLPFGDYTFKVRGRVGNKISENMATYSFSIERPWLLSNTMILTYLLIVALFSVFMHNVYKRYYRKQREKLEQKTKMEFDKNELQSKQQLMFLNNEKLRQDIENKNRELAISTMSLIKKNEFLNTLKSELKKAPNNSQGIKSAIRMIDSNLNNTDDWHVFEEAFNNADKDFLKKIKSLHSSLTSNDLRLCAYLRLNLSSKEIAPLLNISPRSVEVKRYRLRKKLNLDHDASLSDYILEV